MSSIPDRSKVDSLNQACYDNRDEYWDRFPFPDILPTWIRNAPQRGKQVLDIGCGTGQFAEWLKNQGFEVSCLDPSAVMVNHCTRKGLACVQTTFQNYREGVSTFSMIFAILSFIHIPKQEWSDQLTKISHLLQPHGLFFLVLIEGKGEAIQEASSGFPRFFAYFTREEIGKLTENQFELLKFISVPAPCGSYLLFMLRKR